MKIPDVSLGSIRMPLMGFGTWQIRGEECINAVRSALEIGYNHIDTAHIYGNHKEVGIAIKGHDRESLFITTKAWRDELTRKGILESGRRALEELGIGYIDLFLIHWPNKIIPMGETFRGMAELHDNGIIRAIGVSNFTIRHMEEAFNTGAEIKVNQVEFHPLFYQKDLLEYCNKKNIVLTAYSPIARGAALKHPIIQEIAEETGHTPAQVCLAWILSKGICVIPKSSSKERQEENLESLNVKLSKEHLERIDGIRETYCHRMVNPGFAEF